MEKREKKKLQQLAKLFVFQLKCVNVRLTHSLGVY